MTFSKKAFFMVLAAAFFLCRGEAFAQRMSTGDRYEIQKQNRKQERDRRRAEREARSSGSTSSGSAKSSSQSSDDDKKTKEAEAARRKKEAEIQRMEQIKPEVVMKIDLGKKIDYVIVPNATEACSGKLAAGCVQRTPVYKIETKQENLIYVVSKIIITLGFSSHEIRIDDDYPQGQCAFDKILKHELTHVELGRGVIKRYAPEIAKAVAAKLDTLPLPLTNDGLTEIYQLVHNKNKEMHDEREKQDNLLDEHTMEAWRQCDRPEIKAMYEGRPSDPF